MAAAAASANVSDEDVRMFLTQTVNEYKESCAKGFAEHKFEPITAGLKIGNNVMTSLVDRCTASTQPGQVFSRHLTELNTIRK